MKFATISGSFSSRSSNFSLTSFMPDLLFLYVAAMESSLIRAPGRLEDQCRQLHVNASRYASVGRLFKVNGEIFHLDHFDGRLRPFQITANGMMQFTAFKIEKPLGGAGTYEAAT